MNQWEVPKEIRTSLVRHNATISRNGLVLVVFCCFDET